MPSVSHILNHTEHSGPHPPGELLTWAHEDCRFAECKTHRGSPGYPAPFSPYRRHRRRKSDGRMAETSPSRRTMTGKTLTRVLALFATGFLLGGFICYYGLDVSGFLSGDPAAAQGAGNKNGASPVKQRSRGPKAMLVRVGTIQRKPIVPVKTLVGDLIAVRKATIPSEVAGKVVKLPVDEGTKVIGGKTLLARIDETWTDLEERKIAAQIAEKKATLAFAKDEFRRYKGMLKDDAIPLSDVEKERTLIKELDAFLLQLNVMLKEVRERKTRLDIIAPFDGSVVAKYAELGEYVSVGSPIVDIVSNGRIDVRIMVPEESLPLIDVGSELDLVVDSLGLELRGKVFSINVQGSVGSRTFPVRVQLDDQKGKLMPGMGVSVFVPVMRETTELLVPRDAVLTKPDGSTIWVLRPKKTQKKDGGEEQAQDAIVAVPVPVRILSHTRDAYAIACERKRDLDMVHPGVKVVVEGLERLIPGVTVRIDPNTAPLAPVPGMYRTGQQVVGGSE